MSFYFSIRLLKDALLVNKMKQLNYDQSIATSNHCINSSDNYTYTSQPNCNQNDIIQR